MSILTPQINSKDILKEIQAENGTQLFASIQDDLDPFGESSYIDTLDVLFNQNQGILRSNRTTEIQGPPKSGKTSLLLFLCMTILLPYSVHLPFSSMEIEVILGGKGPNKTILLFDCSSKFPIQKMRRMLRDHLDKRINDVVRTQGLNLENSPTDKVRDEIVMNWLNGLLVWRPKDEFGFTADVKLARAQARRLDADGKISLILIPALSTFYPASKLRYERLQTNQTPNPTSKDLTSPSLAPPFSILLSSIRQLQISTNSPLIYSNWNFSKNPQVDLRIPFKSSSSTSTNVELKAFKKDYQIILDSTPTQAPKIKKTSTLREAMISQRIWENEVEVDPQGNALVGIPKLRWIEGWLKTSERDVDNANGNGDGNGDGNRNTSESRKSKGPFYFSVQNDSVTPRPL